MVIRPLLPFLALGAVLLTSRSVGAQTTAPAPAPALHELLARASQNNALPADLISYRANAETEISILLRREEGTEAVAAVEQVASTLRWNRTGAYEQRVTGYRNQQTGANVSMLTIFRTGWLNPSLYGNRLRVRREGASDTVSRRSVLGPGARAARAGARADGADTVPAVHPLATDRDRYYSYSGGDTVVTIQAGERVIHIAQLRVQPRKDLTGDVVLFDGEMQLDADRATLVRLRGTFVRVNGPRRGIAGSLADAIAFIDFENGERQGRYWLPSRQRLELQAMMPMLGDARAVVRIVSRLSDMEVNDTTLSAESLARADSLRARARRKLTYAPSDSLTRFSSWRAAIGTLSVGLHSDDFDAFAPDRMRATGRPRVDFAAPRASDVFHFNRVEGAYTGAGVKLAMRDAAPGVVVRANAGYAWAEQAVRGRLAVTRTRGPWVWEARGGRSMDITNDFRVPFDSGNTFGALASVDPYDYVSRNSGALGVSRRFGARVAIAHAEVGYGDDRYRPSQYVRGPFGGDPFRPNRGIAAGSYLRSAATLEWHPDMAAEFAKPGYGARLSYERGDGTLAWQRAELRLSGRRAIGPLVALARADAGIVTGTRIPPQQLFELGKYQNLPYYGDKQFAGSRAAAVRAGLQYTTPFLRSPIRLGQTLFLPAIAPGLSVGIQSGWADAPSSAARAAIAGLSVVDRTALASYVPVAEPTGRVRASLTAGLRFFGNGLFVGATRPVDQSAPWKALVGFGQAW
jgi:hypothetical protein